MTPSQSQSGSSTNSIEQLIAKLGNKFDLTGEEIADVLWLTLELQNFEANPVKKQQKSGNSGEDKSREQLNPQSNKTNKIENSGSSNPTSTTSSSPSKKEEKGSVYSASNSEESQGLNIGIPDPPSLREPLTLAHALRPLMLRVATGRKLILDEAATVQRIAEERIFIPVLRAEPELWLDLALVIDESHSMLIWGHTIRDLKEMFKKYGIFRDIKIWGLQPDEAGENLQIFSHMGSNKRLTEPKEIIDPTGRRLILIVSDCVSNIWSKGMMFPVLKAWTQKQPLAILQMLPEWMWRRTALDSGTAVGFKSSIMGVANQELSLHKPLRRSRSIGFKVEERSKIPVISLDREKVAQWSQMLIGKADVSVPGYLLPIEEEKAYPSLQSEQNSITDEAEKRVHHFRMTASPLGRELAGLLAASPVINQPVVRLIQESLLPKSNQVQVAEVFLGGLLRPKSASIKKLEDERLETKADVNSDLVEYEFIAPEIRNIFLDDAPVSDSIDVVNAVSCYVAEQIGVTLRDFMAILKAPQKVEEKQRDIIKPFAEITAKVLRRLGGNYVTFAEELERGNTKSEIIESLREQNLDVASLIKQLTAKNPLITDTELGEILKDLLITQKIHDLFVEKFGGGKGNRFSTRNLQLNGNGNKIYLNKGGQINATMEINHDCPECGTAINQIIVGIPGENQAQACVWNGGHTSNGWKPVSFSLNIPYTPGVYYIRTRYAQAYNSEDALGWWKVDRPDGPTEEANIGAIVVGVNYIFEYTGEYICAVKWGGETGSWHEGNEHLLISPQGEVQFHSRFGLAVIQQVIQSFTVQGQTLSWSFDHNRTAASITFKENSENSYFWEEPQTGKLFEGWLNYPDEGRIDFRGKFLKYKGLPNLPPLQKFSFEEVVISIEDDINSELQFFEFEVAVITGMKSHNTSNNPVDIADNLVFSKTERHLSELEQLIIQATISNQTYEQMATSSNYSTSLLKNVATNLWKVLSEALGEKVNKINVKNVIQRQLNYSQIDIQRIFRQGQCFIENLGNGVQLEMVAIPEGSFMMGSSEDEEGHSGSESPQHQVTVKSFFMGKYPVTQAQWKAVAALPQINRELDPNRSSFKGANCPVERVSWLEAVEFCDRLSQHTNKPYRLPSEAEWEYACRAGTITPFHFGETITTDLANYNGSYTYGAGSKEIDRQETTPVGSFGVANAFGLYDMHGNVWEWCADRWHSNYQGAPNDGSPWVDPNENKNDSQIRRGLRGGS